MLLPSFALLLVGPFLVYCQDVSSVGVNGGSGPSGGQGDIDNPVAQAQSWITDAKIPTTPGTTRQLAQGAAPIRVSSSSTDAHNVVVDDAEGKMQQLVGFGHAWTDSTVQVFNDLEPDLLDQVMKDLFGQAGNNMGLMRHTIGSSDLSGQEYSYDDTFMGASDPSLSSFSFGSYGRAMADLIAKTGDYKSDVTVFGSPWSAPAWVKENKMFTADKQSATSAYGGVNNTLDASYVTQYAEYFGKYVDAFAQRGAIINAITPQNEPLNNQGGYPCMYLPADEESTLINSGLGSAMQERNVSIWAYDHNTDEPYYPQQVVESSPGQVQAAAWHCYESPVANYSKLTDFNAANPDLLQFMTECTTYMPQPNEIHFVVARNFLRPVQNYASGATMWVMATNPQFGPHTTNGGCDGCLGSIVVQNSTSYTKTHDYYMIGQFSRFLRRGSVNYRVTEGNYGTPYTTNQLEIIAVQNPDKSWAVVFLNNYQDVNVTLQFTGSSDMWQGTVDNSTVTTWVLPSFSSYG